MDAVQRSHRRCGVHLQHAIGNFAGSKQEVICLLRIELGRKGEHQRNNAALAADFAVTGTRSDFTIVQPYANVSLVHSFQAQGVTYLPQVNLGYRYNTHSMTEPVVQITAEDGTVFAAPAAAQGRGMGTANARVTAEAGASWSLYVDYQGLFAGRLNDNSLSVGFTKHF
jgi:uncharacterized protein with beta-barrel porin domain